MEQIENDYLISCSDLWGSLWLQPYFCICESTITAAHTHTIDADTRGIIGERENVANDKNTFKAHVFIYFLFRTMKIE